MISIAYEPIQRALDYGLLPVVYGDVVFDRSIGASIASTEAIFALLVEHLKPSRLLLAGLAEGVYEKTGSKSSPIPEITPSMRVGLEFTSPEGQDVTGGMADKVDFCLSIAQSYPQIEILIFSAEEPGLLFQVLCDQSAGTRIRS
jgi:isopentenyl phosphate kinase